MSRITGRSLLLSLFTPILIFGVVGGAETVTVAGGIATVTLTDTVVETFEVAITNSAALTTPANDSIVVTAGPPTKMGISVQPSNADATIAISPAIKVQVQDANGNLVSSATDLISLALVNSLGGATLSGTFTDVAPDNGEVTFSDISIGKAQNEYVLIASATGLSSAASAPFNITVRPDHAGGLDRE